MPFCPKCRSEYVAGSTECSDCHIGLVAALTEVEAPPDMHWVELATAGSEAEGELLCELLEQAGIPVMMKKDVFVSSFGRQGTLIFVPAKRYDEAVALSGEPEPGEPEPGEPENQA